MTIRKGLEKKHQRWRCFKDWYKEHVEMGGRKRMTALEYQTHGGGKQSNMKMEIWTRLLVQN